MLQTYGDNLPSWNTLYCATPLILSAWCCSICVHGFTRYKMHLQSRMLSQTFLDGRQGGLFTHSFSPYGPVSLTHSLCQQAFMDLEAAFILLYNVSPCNWVSSGLDERIQQFHFEWIPSENFSLMLVCYPQMRVSWVAHPEFIYNLPPLLSQQIHWKVNMTYIFKIASLCMLVCARYWK